MNKTNQHGQLLRLACDDSIREGCAMMRCNVRAASAGTISRIVLALFCMHLMGLDSDRCLAEDTVGAPVAPTAPGAPAQPARNSPIASATTTQEPSATQPANEPLVSIGTLTIPIDIPTLSGTFFD